MKVKVFARAAMVSMLLTILPSPLTTGLLRAAEPTKVSPYYFGPNAFPIPEIMDRTQSRLVVEVDGNYFSGTRGDHTTDITLKTIIPLFTSRANLSIWLPVTEWYRHSDRYLADCGIEPPYDEKAWRGALTGDVYVTTDIQILEEKRLVPDLTIRAALKTASGGQSGEARYYDCPGYFFDMAVGKTFTLSSAMDLRLRAAASAGFLCWQTAKDRQNDAVMYGVKLGLSLRRVSLSATFAGYSGWEHLATTPAELARDHPMSLRTRLQWELRSRWQLFAQYEHGFADYPYRHVGIGVACCIPVLPRK